MNWKQSADGFMKWKGEKETGLQRLAGNIKKSAKEIGHTPFRPFSLDKLKK